MASGRSGGGGGHGTLSAFTALSSELVLEILQLLDDAALRNAGESCRLLGALEATEWQQRAMALAGDAPGAAGLRGVPVPEGGARAHGWRGVVAWPLAAHATTASLYTHFCTASSHGTPPGIEPEGPLMLEERGGAPCPGV